MSLARFRCVNMLLLVERGTAIVFNKGNNESRWVAVFTPGSTLGLYHVGRASPYSIPRWELGLFE